MLDDGSKLVYDGDEYKLLVGDKKALLVHKDTGTRVGIESDGMVVEYQ
jgi:hypothetical protein